MTDDIKIKRLTSFSEFALSEINALFDVGTSLDEVEGNKFITNRDNAFFVATSGDKLAGFATAHRLQRFDARKAEVLLYEVGVKAEYRQKGIGKLLIETVKQWAVEVGADEVWVLTNKSNMAANALYQSMGGKVENTDDVMYVFKLETK